MPAKKPVTKKVTKKATKKSAVNDAKKQVTIPLSLVLSENPCIPGIFRALKTLHNAKLLVIKRGVTKSFTRFIKSEYAEDCNAFANSVQIIVSDKLIPLLRIDSQFKTYLFKVIRSNEKLKGRLLKLATNSKNEHINSVFKEHRDQEIVSINNRIRFYQTEIARIKRDLLHQKRQLIAVSSENFVRSIEHDQLLNMIQSAAFVSDRKRVNNVLRAVIEVFS